MKWQVLLPILLAICALILKAPHAFGEDGAAAPATGEPKPIALIPGDSMNLEIVEQIDPHYVVVKVGPNPVHNWFAGTFTNLPTDKEVTIGLSMAGCNTPGNSADVRKWVGLRPVMTYADPNKYETYEWFQKDELGRWVSGDPFKQGDAKFAGIGKVPEQNVIPKEVAEQFLSEDGKYWQAWREVDRAEAITGINILRMKDLFRLPTATIAMRLPYPNTYQQHFIKRIVGMKYSDVTIDEVGKSGEGRKLQVVRIETSLSNEKDVNEKPTVLVYSREHATEPDSSWVSYGALCWLLSDSEESNLAREQFNWLFIIILDPDGVSQSLFSIGDDYAAIDPYRIESINYAKYLVGWVSNKHRLDVVMNLHNIECNEDKNISSPFINRTRIDSIRKFNKMLFAECKLKDYSIGDSQGWDNGIMGKRLYGWCFRRFNSLDLAFETNSRNPVSRLTIQRSQTLGSIIIKAIVSFVKSKDFIPVADEITLFLKVRTEKEKQWWAKEGRSRENRNLYDLFTKGY